MKKFRFTLRSVQTVRSIRELRAREQFSLSIAELARVTAEAEQADQRMARLQQVLLGERGPLFRGADQVAYLQAIEVAKRELIQAQNAVTKATLRRDECREAWIATRMDVRIIENLEKKARQQHLHEFEREEQSALDDRSNALVGRAPLMMP
jgi:flagellar FliJ protein